MCEGFPKKDTIVNTGRPADLAEALIRLAIDGGMCPVIPSVSRKPLPPPVRVYSFTEEELARAFTKIERTKRLKPSICIPREEEICLSVQQVGKMQANNLLFMLERS